MIARTLFLAGALAAAEPASAGAEEIKTQCPRVNDAGSRLASHELVRESGKLLAAYRVAARLSGVMEDTVKHYRDPSGAPIDDATFVCRYGDGSEERRPVPGALLSCRTFSAHLKALDFLRTACISETEPARLPQR